MLIGAGVSTERCSKGARVVIIGAGQIGSWHLQGLAPLLPAIEVYVYDPSPHSLNAAAARLAERVEVKDLPVRFTSTVSALPEKVDLLISATDARHRLTSLQHIMKRREIDAFLLEKVLFQQVHEYAEFATMVGPQVSRVWVNCPRRLWPIYQRVRQLLDGRRIDLRVSGGRWGLGCNGIHFIDLFEFLTGELPIDYNIDDLAKVVHPAKRNGFNEFSGTLRAISEGGSTLTLISNFEEEEAGVCIEIYTPTKAIQINEGKGICVKSAITGEVLISEQFQPVFQSDLTHIIASAILQREEVSLPSYSISAPMHINFINALLAHLQTISNQICTVCPIT